MLLFLCSSDDCHRADDKTECSGSDDSEEVITKKVKFSLHSPRATENSLENDQGFAELESEMGDKCDKLAGQSYFKSNKMSNLPKSYRTKSMKKIYWRDKGD